MAIGDSARFGYEASLGIAEETTFGTKVDSFAYVEFNSESLKLNREELKLESINTSRDYIKRMLGQDSVEGSIELFFNPAEDACVRLMKQAMGGTVSSSTLTAGAIAHTLNAGDMENNQSTSGAADVKSLSIQLSIGDTSTNSIGWDYLGCRINSLSLKGEIGSPVIMTTEIIGKAASTTASTPTVSFSDIKPVNFTGITLQTGDSITNVSAETFIGFELTINNNLVGDTNARGLGSRTVNVLPPSRREVMLKLTQRFDTLTSYNRAIQGTMTAIKIILDSEQTITAGGSTYSTAINLPACYFNSNQPEFSDFGILTHEVEVSAIKENTTSSYSVQIQINNATNNY